MDGRDVWSKSTAVWKHTATELSQLEDRIDPAAIASVTEAIKACTGKVITMGAGTSAAAAKKIAHTMSCIERPALFLSPADAVHGGLGVVQPDDLVILISKGGNTRELVALIPSLETKGCATIAVSENAESILAKRADQLLKVFVSGEPDQFDMLATTSTAAVIAVFDAIAIVVMEATGFTREQFGVIHPGGAVGDRLLGTEQKKDKENKG